MEENNFNFARNAYIKTEEIEESLRAYRQSELMNAHANTANFYFFEEPVTGQATEEVAFICAGEQNLHASLSGKIDTAAAEGTVFSLLIYINNLCIAKRKIVIDEVNYFNFNFNFYAYGRTNKIKLKLINAQNLAGTMKSIALSMVGREILFSEINQFNSLYEDAARGYLCSVTYSAAQVKTVTKLNPQSSVLNLNKAKKISGLFDSISQGSGYDKNNFYALTLNYQNMCSVFNAGGVVQKTFTNRNFGCGIELCSDYASMIVLTKDAGTGTIYYSVKNGADFTTDVAIPGLTGRKIESITPVQGFLNNVMGWACAFVFTDIRGQNFLQFYNLDSTLALVPEGKMIFIGKGENITAYQNDGKIDCFLASSGFVNAISFNLNLLSKTCPKIFGQGAAFFKLDCEDVFNRNGNLIYGGVSSWKDMLLA